jgi:hypothetical protein
MVDIYDDVFGDIDHTYSTIPDIDPTNDQQSSSVYVSTGPVTGECTAEETEDRDLNMEQNIAYNIDPKFVSFVSVDTMHSTSSRLPTHQRFAIPRILYAVYTDAVSWKVLFQWWTSMMMCLVIWITHTVLS